VYRRRAGESGETLFIKVHDAWSRVGAGEPMFPADVTLGVVYVIRNPLDMAASCAHHWGTSLTAAVEMLCGDRTIARLTCQLSQRLGSWSEHVRSWVDDCGAPLHVLRYEDLTADPRSFFGGVVKFCGLGDDEDRVARAVAFSSFAELRRQEAAAGFRERSAASNGAFFRRGQAGSWHDELPAELAERLTGAHHQTMRRFGYAP
jgi:hypothetical protein